MCAFSTQSHIDLKDNEFLAAAHQLADLAAEISIKHFKSDFNVELKDGGYPVTQIDKEIELCLRKWLKNNYPDHNIIGEEFNNQQGNANQYTWVIDPIDGTVSYVTGKPLFTTLIALLKDGEPIIGIIDQPVFKDRFVGVVGGGSWLNGKPIKSNDLCSKLQDARLNATTPYMFKSMIEQNKFNHLHNQVKVTSFGGDSYAYGLLAKGSIDVILEADLQFYDIAALIPIITEAGGLITDWQGKQLTINFNGQCLATANRGLHNLALNIIKSND